jgi:hypothetical protein
MAYSRFTTAAPKHTTPRQVRTVRGAKQVWFYMNDESIDVYVRPEETGHNGPGAASIWFRIWLRDLVRRVK